MNKIIIGMAANIVLAISAHAAVIDFEDKTLSSNSAFNTSSTTTWSSGDADFLYSYNYSCCWSGFTYSNETNNTDPGFMNDQSAITGDGVGAGQDNYAVGYLDAYSGAPVRVLFDGPKTVQGSYFTNTTYSYLAVANGDDGNDPAFVKGPFAEDDFFKLTVSGLNAAGAAISSLDILLADGADVIDEWEWFGLSGLGEVYGLSFTLTSSDTGTFGMNTPGYFAMDNLTIVPLPAAVWLFASALGLLGFRYRQKA
ncbi:MAG: DUF4465 domain-containing protein [Gammaproteobacteria bacterium]|nr:DUF4465 domain-containing protein [Gammaproteobacteria bacterium]